jgi:hypothetical protein
MSAASLHGSSVPLDSGGYVVTVVCPNAYSHMRLMQALQNIVPDAGEPTPQPERQNAYIAGFEPNEDGVIAPKCANGACGVD